MLSGLDLDLHVFDRQRKVGLIGLVLVPSSMLYHQLKPKEERKRVVQGMQNKVRKPKWHEIGLYTQKVNGAT